MLKQKDVYRAFYTSDTRLVKYMIDLLSPQDGDECLEPSAGNGFFVDGLLETGKRLNINALELSPEASAFLENKYQNKPNVLVQHKNFFDLSDDLFVQNQYFDKIIANPPYGGWLEYTQRKSLKLQFPDLYVKETYSLFIAQSLERLKPNGVGVFIVPETFLYLHLHLGLRKRILRDAQMVSIDVFPSSFFPNVQFGYAKLCIIKIKKQPSSPSDTFHVQHCQRIEELLERRGSTLCVQVAQVLAAPDLGVPLAESIPPLSTAVVLGELADCVTGFYSGEDGKYLYRTADNQKKANKYQCITPEQLALQPPDLSGYTASQCFIPVLKGGGHHYLKPLLWCMNWSKEAVKAYKTSPKARFQNSQFYFRQGIGFPMVSSGKATASLIQAGWLFDQSVVGIFPKNSLHLGFLLAFLNSQICWRLLRQINPSANNSANYLRRLPICLPAEPELEWFNSTVMRHIETLKAGQTDDTTRELLNQKITELYSLHLN
jgi:adenine-specific DNA-methyltransferase